jgi:hypothetical protein
MKKREIVFLCLFVSLVAHAQTSTPPSAGDGTSNNPYQIETLDNLYWLSQTSSAWGSQFIQTADIDASGTATWDSGLGFSPIGNSSTNFTGYYNGQGHVISGLTINRPSQDYVGLFGYASSINMLGLPNCSITGHDFVGGLAGFASAHINQCFATGTVSGSDAGGLVGKLWIYGSINNSYAMGNVSNGYGVSGLVSDNYGTISNCYASSTVSGSSYKSGLILNGNAPTNSFYNKDISSSSKGTGVTTDSMKILSTFTNAGWDFVVETTNGISDIWAMSNDINNGFPCLTWQVTPAASVISTQAASDITGNTATGNGTITTMGSPNPTYHGFCYGTSVHPTTANSTVNLGGAKTVGTFTGPITGLTANTTYYVRTYATNSTSTVYGEEVSFTTLTTDKPLATTLAASNITDSSITFNGTVTANNLSTTVEFEYGTTTSYGNTIMATQSPLDGSSATAVSATMTGLLAGTNYFVRVKAVNSLGTSYGDSVKVTTTPKGSGISSDPYQITNLDNLIWLSQNSSMWSKSFVQTVDIDASATSSLNGGSGLYTIGDASNNFTGTYDGQKHMISGLTIHRPTTNYIGLFGFTNNAIINNLSLTNCNISGNKQVGGLVGCLLGGSIMNCSATGSVTASSTSSGGLAGQNYGTISYSYAEATVSGNNYVGGLIGWSESSTTSNCYSSGAASGKNVGGLIGIAKSCSLKNCYSSETVSGSTTNGLIGQIQISSSISSCFYNSSLSSSDNGTGKTTAELQELSTFTNAGWDFSGESTNGSIDKWAMSSSINNGLPCFSWQGTFSSPAVSTDSIVDITNQSILAYGKLTTVGFPNPKYGFCYSTKTNPSLTDSIWNIGTTSTTQTFSCTITALKTGTTYYLRAYALNALDTVYGDQVTFTKQDIRQLSVKAYLQGLFNGTNMNQCMTDDGSTPAFASPVADTLSIELHDASNYSSIVYRATGLYLKQNGSITSTGKDFIEIPPSYSGSYYITVKTRNHIETTSATPIDFSGSSTSYDFTDVASKAYGNNLGQVGELYVIYAGDLADNGSVQDGVLDGSDISLLENQVYIFGVGYLKEDLNGDGIIDGSDIAILDTNILNFISVVLP